MIASSTWQQATERAIGPTESSEGESGKTPSMGTPSFWARRRLPSVLRPTACSLTNSRRPARRSRLQPIVQNVLLVHSAVPARSLKALTHFARAAARAGLISASAELARPCSSPGLLRRLTGTKRVMFRSKGGGQTTTSLISVEVDILVVRARGGPSHSVLQNVAPSRVVWQALALPQVATATDAGCEQSSWSFDKVCWHPPVRRLRSSTASTAKFAKLWVRPR